MPTEVWGYLDPDTYDDIGRSAALYQASLQYPGVLADSAIGINTVIVAHTAHYRNYDDGIKYPLTLDLLDITLAYIDNPSGTWNQTYAPDMNNNHIRQNLYDVSHVDVLPAVNEKRYSQGIMYVEDADVNYVFYPAFRNQYANSSSMLQGMFIGFVVADLLHIDYSNWVRLVGSNNTDAQYTEKTVDYINQQIAGRFDNRYKYTVSSTITAADAKRRYSWTTGINIKGSAAKTVNRLSISGSSR